MAADGGAFAFEDEVDPRKVGRGVTAGARRVVVSSGHDAPPVLVVCERGRRNPAPALLTVAMNRPSTRPPPRGYAERDHFAVELPRGESLAIVRMEKSRPAMG